MAQLIQLPLRNGIEEGADPKALPPGTLLVGENCRQDKAGRVRKRRGTALVTKATIAGGTIASGSRLFSNRESLGIFDGTNVDSYSEVLAKWQTIDQPSPLMVTQTPLLDTVRSAELVDQAIFNGLIVTVWMAGISSTAAPIYVEVRELASGASVLPPTQVIAAGINPRVLIRPSTSTAYILWADGSGNIAVRTLPLTTFLMPARILLPGTFIASQIFDAQIVGTELFIVGSLAAGANRIRVDKFALSDPTFLTHTPCDLGGAVVGTCCCVDASDGTNVFVAYSTSSVTRAVTVDYAAMTVSVGPSTIDGVPSDYVFIAVHSSTRMLFGYSPSASSSGQALTTLLIDHSLVAVAASTRKSFGLYSPSKPWRVNSRWYCRALAFVHSYNATSTDPAPATSSVVIEIRTDDYTAVVAPHRHRATLENQISWYSLQNGGHLTQPALNGSDVYIASVYTNREPVNFDVLPLGWNQNKITIGGSDAHRPLTLGRVTMGVAGAPFVADGATTEPAGFVHAPMIVSGGPGIGGSGLMAAGVYQYIAVYVWRDENGVLHRSIPSPPKSFTAAASGSVTFKVSTTSISSKQSETTGFGAGAASPVMIEIYRTIVNGGDFYRLTLAPLYQVFYNDPTVADITVADTKADTNIGNGAPAYPLSAQAQLYLTQEVEDVSPPALTCGTVHHGRFAGIASDQRTLWLSKDINEDPTVFPGFNEALILVFDRDKFALRSLNERLIVFGEDNIDLVEGDGPDATGNQNTWRISRFQTDVGCTNPKSLVIVPAGLMFQSGTDILLLGSDLQLTWMGRPASDRLAQFPNITSSVLCPDDHEVRFTCNAADGLTGIVLVFDYENHAWYVRKYFDVDSSTANMPIVDAALINGVYTMLMASGRVYRESSTTCRDGGTAYVSMVAEILVIPAGNQAWARLKDVQILGTSLTDHDLTIQIARDFGSAFEQSKTFLANTIVTTPGPLEKARVTVARQKGQAFRVRVSDATPTGGEVNVGGLSGEGLILEGLTLWVGAKSGPAKVSAGRKG